MSVYLLHRTPCLPLSSWAYTITLVAMATAKGIEQVLEKTKYIEVTTDVLLVWMDALPKWKKIDLIGNISISPRQQ